MENVRGRTSLLLKRGLLVFLLVPLWVYLRSVYRDRIGAFGCFDDCNNIMGGYFLLGGKHLFSEIFFNHMPLMAHISAWIQEATKPESIYMLIYQHRMFVIYLSVIADILLILRFGVPAFAFAVLYESTKGFVFGERFLAEAIVVYPMVYLIGIAWGSLRGNLISKGELWISAAAAFVVTFGREPYVPLTLFLLGTILWKQRKMAVTRWVLVVFFVTCALLVSSYGWGEFVFNVFTVNRLNIQTEAGLTASQSGGLAGIFLYPVLLFIVGVWNLFHQIEAGLTSLFFVIVGMMARKKMWKTLLWVFALLVLANVRAVVPGAIFYGAFHHLMWYSAYTFLISVWVFEAGKPTKIVLAGAFFGITAYAIASPASYLHEKVDRQTEFATNYGNYFVVGEVVRRLSDPTNTLFLDGQDDLIYWQAGRRSPYPYSWYTSLMPFFPVYTEARLTMFRETPPDYYYKACTPGSENDIPSSMSARYVRLEQGGKPSCLWVRADVVRAIGNSKWETVSEFSYSLPASFFVR